MTNAKLFLQKISFPALLVAALGMTAALPAPGYARHHDSGSAVQSGDVLVPKGETLNEDVITSGAIDVEGAVNGDCVSLGGPVTVAGEVLGDVAAMGGNVLISGKVKGDVAAMGGNVDLRSTADVTGSVALLGGRLSQAPGASVRNGVTHLDIGLAKRFLPLITRDVRVTFTEDGVETSNVLGRLSFMARIAAYAAFLAFIAGVGLMILLLTVFLPRNVEAAAEAIKTDFWRSAGIGTLIVLLTSPGLLLMVVSILGIPLIPLALLLYCAAMLLALAAFSVLLSERLYEALSRPLPAGVLARVGMGYLVLIGLSIVGQLARLLGSIGGRLGGVLVLANLILISCGLLVGLGAAWTTRMGSRKSNP